MGVPTLAEREWRHSEGYVDGDPDSEWVVWGWCYGDYSRGECEDIAEHCRQPGNTYKTPEDLDRELEYCQDPDNYWRAGLPPLDDVIMEDDDVKEYERDFSVYDSSGNIIIESLCYGTFAYCADKHAAWYDFAQYDYDGNLEKEIWCYGTWVGCDSGMDHWCEGTYDYCLAREGHVYNGTSTPMEKLSPLKSKDYTASSYHAGKYDENGVLWSIDSDLSLKLISLAAGESTYMYSLHSSEYAAMGAGKVVDADLACGLIDPDDPTERSRKPESVRVLLSGGIVSWNLPVGINTVDCNVIWDKGEAYHRHDVIVEPYYGEGSGNATAPAGPTSPKAKGVGPAASLFTSEEYELGFGLVMDLHGAGLGDGGVLRVIKYFHSIGVMAFDIGAGDGIGEAPARPVCGPGWTVGSALAAVAFGDHDDAQKRHCLELIAERGHFEEESIGP